MPILVLLAVAAVGWWFIQIRRRRAVVRTDTWEIDPREPNGALPIERVASPASPRGSVGAVAGALSRVEAGTVATSLSFAIGIVFCAAAVLGINSADAIENDAILGRIFQHTGLLVFPLTGMTLIALNRATLRARREGTLELLQATPTSTATRTVAHLLSVWPAAFAGAATSIVAVATLATRGHATGGWGPDWAPEILLAPLLVVGGGALGVAFARWIPHGIVPPIVLFGILFATVSLNGLDPSTNLARYWSVWTGPPSDLDPRFMTRPAWPHLVYVAGLVAIVAVVAILRTRHDRFMIGMAAVAVVVAGAGATTQAIPVTTADADRIAARIDGPLECRTRGTVRACTYPGYGEWRADWTAAARRVFVLVPPAARPSRYLARQSIGSAGLRNLNPQVRARLHDPNPVSSYGFGGSETALVWYLLPAQAVAGLPTFVPSSGTPCYAGDQARAVLALWLARSAAPKAFDSSVAVLDGDFDGMGETWFRKEAPWATVIGPAGWDTDVDNPVVYARADIDTARRMQQRRPADIHRALARHNLSWTDPNTPTAALIKTLGLTGTRTGAAHKVPTGLVRCQ